MTWFISGTSSGFGRELTEQLLRRGDTVAATLRSPAGWMIWPQSTATGCGCAGWM